MRSTGDDRLSRRSLLIGGAAVVGGALVLGPDSLSAQAAPRPRSLLDEITEAVESIAGTIPGASIAAVDTVVGTMGTHVTG